MKFFVTTPIYYVNDKPHLGHAYTSLAADMLARFHRFIGDDTFFLTGTDEHGAKVAEVAEKKGIDPQQFVDEVSSQFRGMSDTLNISYDRFIRTTETEHAKTVKQFLIRMHERGFIYKGEYKGLYCRGCEEFKKEGELVEGKCPLHNRIAEEISEPTYFFKLSAFRDDLTGRIASDQLKIEPKIRKNEVLAFLEGNELEDISISRQNVAWGIPVPWDPEFTVYVWVDALINYYTAGKGSWPPTWHIIAKDILRFHCIIWPAMLLAADVELPKAVFVHGFFTIDGKKMSKTLGNVIDPVELSKHYPADALRLFLFKAYPFGNDGDFSYSLLDEVYTGALANELGNLVQRVLVMTEKYCGSEIPEAVTSTAHIAMISETWDRWEQALLHLHIDEAFRAVWDLIRLANQRIDETRPWDLVEKDRKELEAVLYELLEVLRHICLLLVPLMPSTAQSISALLQFRIQEKQTREEYLQQKQWGKLVPGAHVTVGKVLFPRKG